MNKKKTKEEFKKMINLPEMFYQPDNDKIWMRMGGGVMCLTEKVQSSLDLSMSMSCPRKESAELFAKTYKDHVVDLVTPIGGWRKGMHEISGKKVLVPWEQRRIEPKRGEWEIIRKFLTGMLGT
jgi:hypothetical protein